MLGSFALCHRESASPAKPRERRRVAFGRLHRVAGAGGVLPRSEWRDLAPIGRGNCFLIRFRIGKHLFGRRMDVGGSRLRPSEPAPRRARNRPALTVSTVVYGESCGTRTRDRPARRSRVFQKFTQALQDNWVDDDMMIII